MASSGRWKFGNVRPTGSAIVMGLPYLDQAMRVWGRSSGLEVVMMNADTVSETNCVRQPFSVSDIGQNKATVLINRINLFWGTQWRAEVRAKSKTSAKAAQPKTEVTQNASTFKPGEPAKPAPKKPASRFDLPAPAAKCTAETDESDENIGIAEIDDDERIERDRGTG